MSANQGQWGYELQGGVALVGVVNSCARANGDTKPIRTVPGHLKLVNQGQHSIGIQSHCALVDNLNFDSSARANGVAKTIGAAPGQLIRVNQGQPSIETHGEPALVDNLNFDSCARAKCDTKPREAAPGHLNLVNQGHARTEGHSSRALVDSLINSCARATYRAKPTGGMPGHPNHVNQGQMIDESHSSSALVDIFFPISARAKVLAKPIEVAPGHTFPFSQETPMSTFDPAVGLLHDPLLLVMASQLDDLEAIRCATDNRIRMLTTPSDKLDEDGKTRGLGYSKDHPDVLKVVKVAETIASVETIAINQLEKHMANSAWSAWIKSATGVGEKTLARLLAATGDPYWNTLYQRPRTVSELWRYCGFDVVDGQSRKRRRGEKAMWSFEARKRAWVIADICKRQREGTKYRDIFLARRLVDQDAVHVHPCAQCGKKGGNPAEPGTPLKPGHQQARALRQVAKEVLRDLWIEARAHYVEQGLVSIEQGDGLAA